MRLWVALDEKICFNDIEPDDILLSNQVIDDHFKKCCNFVSVDLNIAREDEELYNSINNMFLDLNSDVRTLMNPIYIRVFLPLASVVLQVDALLEKNAVTELILLGGTTYPFFTLRHGGGEGKKILFRLSWLVCPFLYEKYKDNKNIKIRWNQCLNPLFMKLFHYCREKLFWIKIVFATILKNIEYDNNKLILQANIRNKKVIVTYTQKALQLRYLQGLFQNVSNFNIFHITHCKLKGKDIVDIAPAGFFNIIKLIGVVNKSLSNIGNLSFYWKEVSFTFDKILFKRLVITELFYNKLMVLYLNNTLLKNILKPDLIVTDMTFGGDLQAIHDYCTARTIKHCNFQYTAMAKLLFPQMELADVYYLYSKKVFNLNKKYSQTYKFYLPTKKASRNIINDKIIVTLFTQPDSYAQRYLLFIQDFCSLINQLHLNIEFRIKLHPRQNKIKEFKQLLISKPFVSLIENDISVSKVIVESNFIMSMTSSVLFEAVLLGIPAIIIDIDGVDSDFLTNNDLAMEEVNFRCSTMEDIVQCFKRPDKTIQLYEHRRNRFIESTNALKDINQAFK